MSAKPVKLSDQFKTMFGVAVRLAKLQDVDAMLIWVDAPLKWDELPSRPTELTIVVASDEEENVAGAVDHDLDIVLVDTLDAPVNERLSQALLESIVEDILAPSAKVVALYNAFEPDTPDSVSFIQLDEHLARFTQRDLRELGDSVPLETLKAVVDLAVALGREGREGKHVGTMFVVGDSRKVLASCHSVGFDPVKGYKRAERNLRDKATREAIKEVATLDGAFIVSADGTVEAACQLIETTQANVTLSKGLGTRHWAAAVITEKTGAVAVAVSESGGTVRIFQKGEVVLRIEPFRAAMKWKRSEATDTLGSSTSTSVSPGGDARSSSNQ